ncbi:unnamed protein product [Ceutorhynchus assimilis]|uniref:Glucose-methanol-choline oxidoreductase N-terminal domain-containing protein n=1 Tax=Ceutorhynchus assimilis TaxID=467358 RepID=A0A9N9MKW5_9CUCU|nr:unnamed protein product [Ceutorhynchus assimilis]
MIFGRTFIIFIYFLFVLFFGLILRFSHIFSDFCETFHPPDNKQTYDYIIVGGGSAGSILANKLSRNGIDKVLVLEAGKNTIDLLSIPSISLLLQNSPYDWKYATVPQKNSCLGLNQNVSLWPMGKLLGGTSMLNNMLYVRGHKEDFNEWFKDKEDYYYSDVINYFKQIEDLLDVSDLAFSTELSDIVFNAAENLGYSILHCNYDSKLGFNKPKATLNKGKRWTSADSLKQLHRNNLVIRTSCLVEKILFRSNFEAYGVKFKFLNKNYEAFAQKAVILSAGVIGSPKILMLSGIGEKTHLEKLGIEPIVDLPVGNNLQDHLTTGLDLVLLDHSLNIGIEQMLSPFALLEYFLKGSGPLTTTGCEVMAFLNTTKTHTKPDIQFMIMPLGIKEDNGYYLRTLMGISDNVWSNYFAKIPHKSLTILPVLLHPKSRGTVRLASKNPLDQPLIDPQYLSDPRDVAVLIEGIELIKKLISTKEFKSFGAEFNQVIFPGCSNYIFDTKDYWECYIRHLTITAYHPIGTCRMGKTEDPTTVVDFNFQVKGTNKLYVVDGSVIPSLTSGNINGPILMLAGMAADALSKINYLSTKTCDFMDVFLRENICCV